MARLPGPRLGRTHLTDTAKWRRRQVRAKGRGEVAIRIMAATRHRRPAEAGTPAQQVAVFGLLVSRLQAVLGHNANCCRRSVIDRHDGGVYP